MRCSDGERVFRMARAMASPFAGEVTLDRLISYLGGVPEITGCRRPPPKKLDNG
jgi:hypothetical protein